MILTISDLHLSTTTDKPMDIFGKAWIDHDKKIIKEWNSVVKNEDTVILPGDLSWALKRDEVIGDLAFLDSLNGKKIITKGNHDLWWDSHKKLQDLLSNFSTIDYIHNNSKIVEGIGICACKGWDIGSNESSDLKLIRRESMRLQKSIDSCSAEEKIVFMHYPPLDVNHRVTEFVNVLQRNNIKEVYFGHLHGDAINNALLGEIDGINYHIVASDQIGFRPIIVRGGNQNG